MMKKAFLLAFFFLMICFTLSACNHPDAQPTTGSTQQTTDSGEDDQTNQSSGTQSACQHTFGAWNTVKQATCKEEGKRTRSCTKCSEVETEVVQKNENHTVVSDKAVLATCKATGLTAGSHCSLCNKVLTAQKTTPATAHTFVEAQDYISYKCSGCGLKVIEHGNADGSLSGGNENVKYYVTGDLESYQNFEIVIYGKGDMPNFSKTELPVWNDYLYGTVKITIKEGITSIGKYAFYCPDSTTTCSIDMASSVKTVKSNSISLKIKNLVLGSGVELVELNGFGNVDAIYIPKSVKKLYITSMGNETYFYEGSLEEFYQIQLYVQNRTVTVKEYLASHDQYFLSGIHIYVQAKSISDRSHYWK